VSVEVRHLRILLAVVEAGSMSRAAEKLGVTQPSVTRAMSELERQVGTEPPLVDSSRQPRVGSLPTSTRP
jgi:DNA-binding transcriptional LysR family regulator